MESIAKPNKINFKKGKAPNQSSVEIEPFYPGYGMTVGNSMRRVLLSSLDGAAVIGVKIEGVTHEFSTISHIKEDVLEIIMNLKELRLKLFSEEDIKIELDVAGKKQVTAGDIKADSQVEIVNPELVLANITDMAGSLKMEISVGRGRGYRPVESLVEKDKKNEIGYIEMDSVFSPVLSAGLKVENVRVGKMTNWDKLIIDITTDGTITPEEAFQGATDILVDQFKNLQGSLSGEEVKEEKKEEKEEEKEEAEEEVVEEKEEEVKEVKKKKKKAAKKSE